MPLSLTVGPRSILSGYEFDKFFPAMPDFTDQVIDRDGSVEDAVAAMAATAERYKDDTLLLSSCLAGKSIEETSRNIWNFIYSYIQYREDEPGIEQIRRPLRTWTDRQAGVDCDCMSVFASSILKNLKIPHYFRITKYDKPEYQHVYVIVPSGTIGGRGQYFTIDGVIDGFNKEKQFSQNKDFNTMNGIPIHVLNGIDGQSESDDQQLFDYLVATRKAIETNPSLVERRICPCDAVPMFNYVIENFNDPHSRIVAIEKVSQFEAQNFPHLKFFQKLMQYMEGNAAPGHVKGASYLDGGFGVLPFEENGPGYVEFPSSGDYSDGGSSPNTGGSNWWDNWGSDVAKFGLDLFKTINPGANQNTNTNTGNKQNTGGGNAPVPPVKDPAIAQKDYTTTILISVGVVAALGFAFWKLSGDNSKTALKGSQKP